MKRALPPLLLAATLALTAAFRPVGKDAEDLVLEHDVSYAVSSQIEYYRVALIERDGSLRTGHAFIAYRFESDQVLGLWRVIRDDGPYGTLLVRQRDGQPPTLFLASPTNPDGSPVAPEAWSQTLADSDWPLYAALDDDRLGFTYQRGTLGRFLGQPCRIIQATLPSPERYPGIPAHRHELYLSRTDKRFLGGTYFNDSGDPIAILISSIHENISTPNDPRWRARRIEIRDLQDGSTMILSRLAAAYNRELKDAFFSEDQARSWDAAYDQQLAASLPKTTY